MTQHDTKIGTAGETEESDAISVTPLQECQQHIQNLQDALAQERQLSASQETELNMFHQKKYLKDHRQNTTPSDSQWMSIPANQISGLSSMLSEKATDFQVNSAADAAKYSQEAPIRIRIPKYWLQE